MAWTPRARRHLGALATAALALGGAVAATPAAAETPDGLLRWGFRQAFRSYVGGAPHDDPIAVQAPATFDGAGDDLTRPYAFPVASGSVEDAENFAISVAGGVTYDYPSHTFRIDLSDLTLRVVDGEAQMLADVRVSSTIPGVDPVSENDVVVGTSGVAVAQLSPTSLDATVTGLELSEAGADALQRYLSPGAELDSLELSVPLDEVGAIAWTPYLSVLGDEIGTEATQIQVRGYGFEYGRKAAHAMLGGQPVGPYVLLGTVVDPWRPSVEGSESDHRNKVQQIWAVDDELLANPQIGGAGGVSFETDGSFVGTFTARASDFDGMPGQPAVFSYTTNAPIAQWEHLHPVTVQAPVPAAVTGAPRSSTVTVGETARFTARVTGADSLQWQSRTRSGAWRDVAGARGTSLEVAASSVTLSGTQYRIVASNAAGSVTSAAATLTVRKATPAVTLTSKPLRFGSRPTVTVRVSAPRGVRAEGAVVVRWGSKVVGKAIARDGRATVRVSKALTPGTRTLRAEFTGNADLARATSAKVRTKVTKAAAKVTAKLAKKKVRAGKRATVRVKVTARGVKPKGKVRVVVTQGKKKVRTLTGRVKGGTFTKVRLPRLAKGTYRVKATYQGSKTVTKKSTKKITLRVR